MNRLSYLWIALVLLCFSACTRTEQTQDLPPAVPLAPAESPFPPTDPPQPPLVAPFNSDQAKALQKAWADHLGTPVQIANPLGIKFNLIPPGEFAMGSLDSEPGRWGDETQHLVKITKPFYLSVHEVTQAQYEQVMGSNPSENKGPTKPVEPVNWHEVVAFCGKLSDDEGVEYRLPTEAEWEYACRAGTTTAYSFGDDTSRLGKYAWYEDNSTYSTHPVGKKRPNAWGLYDMHGNVEEWCQDWYGDYDLQVVSNPTGPASGRIRVLRGGAFSDPPRYVRAAFRDNSPPAFRLLLAIGFRLARTIPLSP
jgi:formylglycine-generating enzyme required for sulfatase activity